ncbi:mitochondrial ribosomal large subunit component [Thoreauomyces humboldtii]|nr:mitochondrial ribosomal large subunit component [Thoreauomyces humboldtii]
MFFPRVFRHVARISSARTVPQQRQPQGLSRNLSSAFLRPTASPLPRNSFLPTPLSAFHPCAPAPVPHAFSQHRHAVANFRPRRTKYKKAQKGFYPSRSGGSIRGTTVYYGDYGLQALEGGRLSDKQLDSARTAIRRVIKPEKGSRFFLKCFPDRPVTSKGAETRMGKGKGAVDYFATWVAEGKVLIEVKGVRRELAEKAMRVAAAGLPIRTRFLAAQPGNRVPPRVLPHFVRKRLADREFQEFDPASRPIVPTTAEARASAAGRISKRKVATKTAEATL